MSDLSDFKLGSLATKHRPHKFDQIVGNTITVNQVKGMVNSKRVPPAILLHGITGCGKTTMARIIARYLNCDTMGSCGTCESCKSLNSRTNTDVVEIDSTNSSGVDDMRNIIKNANFLPRSRFRVIILDEFHRASINAKEAILKVLENPPQRTLYIIATNHPEKLPPAIVGRCMKLEVDLAERKALAKHLYTICIGEGYTNFKSKEGKSTLLKISDLSGGQVRDAISILEAVFLYLDGQPDLDFTDLLQAYSKVFDVSVDKVSVKVILSLLYNKHVNNAARTINDTTNYRGLLAKMRYTLDDYLGYITTGTFKYKTHSLDTLITQSGSILNCDLYKLHFDSKSDYENNKMKELVHPQVYRILRIQKMLVDIESDFNSLPSPENVIFSSHLIDLFDQ